MLVGDLGANRVFCERSVLLCFSLAARRLRSPLDFIVRDGDTQPRGRLEKLGPVDHQAERLPLDGVVPCRALRGERLPLVLGLLLEVIHRLVEMLTRDRRATHVSDGLRLLPVAAAEAARREEHERNDEEHASGWHADQMMTAALIVNPFSSSVTEPRLQAVEEALSAHARVETIQTSRRDHAVELAREAGRTHEAVLVFSGDGVFNEVLNGLDRPVPVGFIPGGRTNVLPRALGLPRDAVAAARRIGLALETGHTRTISLGRVNGRRFAVSAGLGFDAELIRRIEERGRAHDGRLPGDLVVAWLMTRQLASHPGGYVPALEIEGLGRAAFALVANGDPYSYAGPLALHLVPDASFEFGLDVVAPVSMRARSLPFVFARSVLGRRADRKRLLGGHDLDLIDIRCDVPMPLHVDGEDLGDVTEGHFECERGAVAVLV